MIIHIFQYKLYTAAFIDFINKEYDNGEHFFIVYGKLPNAAFKIKEYSNIIYVDELPFIQKMPDVMGKLKSADKVIIHSNNMWVTKFLLRNPSMLKKSYLVFWGFDIYCYRNKAVGIKNKIYTQIQKWQIRNAKGICVLSDKDKAVLDSFIPGIKGKWFKAAYMSETDHDKLLKLRNFDKSRDPYKIIVGNSASETNQHREIFERLSKYKDENIVVYCPLSYGSVEYRNQVIEYGYEIFGKKFIPLTELMPLEQYRELLNECVAGFYNNSRQQAMGNISILLGLGAKVYIRSDTSMWEKYNLDGYQIYDIELVGNENWSEVISIDENIQKRNASIYESNASLDKKKKIWDEIFDFDSNKEAH